MTPRVALRSRWRERCDAVAHEVTASELQQDYRKRLGRDDGVCWDVERRDA